ncbi:class I SAM-dependent methyltransferase [Treponema primitia]|uniref:class I SAM-dependent methyltransferase n=1 Tax=Treponema primitia TaxID=88058 RepID=UPI00398139D2
MRITEQPLKTAAQAEMLANRLKKRYRHLRKWARRIGTDAFRLYDRDIPEIPLVLDIYGDALAGALYERPYEKDPAEEERWLAAMAGAISQALDIPPERIFLKERGRQRGKVQYERIIDRHELQDVREGGLSFRVNLSDYLDTGLFLDHRKTRSLVRAAAPGKRVLNLFCYTASFSVYAAAGAESVDSVDMSNTYLDWAKTNFAMNKLEALPITPRDLIGNKALPPWRLIRADALRFLDGAAAEALRWDIIILDPPAFSNSKKMTTTLDLKRDHQSLITQCLKLLSPGGQLLFSANTKSFSLDPLLFPGVVIEDIQEKIRDEDFQGKRLPACYTMRI